MSKNSDSSSPKLRFIARITLEATTPILVATGEADNVTDKIFVKDIFGLPYLPATSIAGVLSHLFEKNFDAGKRDELFGSAANKNENLNNDQHGSRLIFSDGLLHDSDNNPVSQQAKDIGDKIDNDDVLHAAKTGIVREHVRIGARGTTDDSGKFNDSVAPKGLRFTFEIEMLCNGDNTEYWKESWASILDLLSHQQFQLGSSTRSGYGGLKVINIEEAGFWLAKDKPEEFLSFDDYCKYPRDLAEATSLLKKRNSKDPSTNTITLKGLKAPSSWLFGGGASSSDEDMVSVEEKIIKWDNNKGSVSENMLLIPGSSIKGAIAHRALFHYRRLNGLFVKNGVNEDEKTKKAFAKLFGEEKGKEDKKDKEDEKAVSKGSAGLLFFNDHYVPLKDEKIANEKFTHVAIDRFTGGARNGALFTERVNLEAELGNYTIMLADEFDNIDEKTRQALECALEDIKRGWLSFGGGAGRGHGQLTCEIIEFKKEAVQ